MVYDYFECRLTGRLLLAADEKGLRHLEFCSKDRPSIVKDGWRQDAEALQPAKEQLAAYFDGRLKRFDLALAPAGTPFQKKVWAALCEIPYGRLVSYLQIARRVGNSKAVRAVGGANGKNPIAIIIPCHRVIGSNGRLTGYGGGLEIKQRLIELEIPGYASKEPKLPAKRQSS
jgi:methylated-DNA-[protein]-cysteine S-methyltransferase